MTESERQIIIDSIKELTKKCKKKFDHKIKIVKGKYEYMNEEAKRICIEESKKKKIRSNYNKMYYERTKLKKKGKD